MLAKGTLNVVLDNCLNADTAKGDRGPHAFEALRLLDTLAKGRDGKPVVDHLWLMGGLVRMLGVVCAVDSSGAAFRATPSPSPQRAEQQTPPRLTRAGATGAAAAVSADDLWPAGWTCRRAAVRHITRRAAGDDDQGHRPDGSGARSDSDDGTDDRTFGFADRGRDGDGGSSDGSSASDSDNGAELEAELAPPSGAGNGARLDAEAPPVTDQERLLAERVLAARVVRSMLLDDLRRQEENRQRGRNGQAARPGAGVQKAMRRLMPFI